jgi:hypothetical protein
MRLPLKITPENLIAVDVFVRIPGYHNSSGNVTFIIDTGSSESLVSEADAIKLKIPISSLVKKERLGHGLAGGTIELRKTKEATITFRLLDGSIDRISVPSIDVGMSSRRDERSIIRDSILGNNFLLENMLKLVFSPSENISYLEKTS